MERWKKRLMAMRREAPGAVAFLCAAFMLGVVPLLFRNAFFDINRFKVSAVNHVVPIFAAAMVLAWLIRWRAIPEGRRRSALWPCLCLCLFLLAGGISYVRSGFLPEVLTGSEGRYCGLWFLLCCGAAFFIVVLGAPRLEAVLVLAVLSATACAVLGLLNSAGIDPLGFYVSIRSGQESIYLGTIGHYDFYGTYLTMIFPLAAGSCVFGRKPLCRLLSGLCAAVIVAGAFAARTDSAFLGVHLAFLALVALSGDDMHHLARALMLWGIGWLTLTAVRELLLHSPYHPVIDSLLRIFCETHAAAAIAGGLILAGLIVRALGRRGMRAPGRKRTVLTAFFLLAAFTALLLGAIVYFSVFAVDADLGSAGSFLRFNDRWGSARGFIYIRSMQAYSDYSWMDKLFGKGIDRTKFILQAYSEHQVEYTGGIVNDAHNQPLQMLLTCGLFGALAFVAFYLTTLFSILRRAGQDPLLCGAFCSLFGYSVIMLLNTSQPILICTYFSISAVAVARLRSGKRQEGKSHES